MRLMAPRILVAPAPIDGIWQQQGTQFVLGLVDECLDLASLLQAIAEMLEHYNPALSVATHAVVSRLIGCSIGESWTWPQARVET